ncbi:hypothetical protein, partial [Streptomyces sp. SAS_260]
MPDVYHPGVWDAWPQPAPREFNCRAGCPDSSRAVPEKQLREEGVFDEYRGLDEAEGAWRGGAAGP